jgi:predicted P-loop ATPase
MKYNGKNSNAFNYISSKYIFRFNVVTNFYEFRKNKKKSKWKKYDDRYKNAILLELMAEHIDVPSDKVNIFIESPDFSPDYNPFEEYFENLKEWDGKKDHIKKISKTVETENSKHFHNTLVRYFVGCIDCLLKPDSVNDVCLVFQSGQGIGKTRWMRSLLPKHFQSEYLYEGNIDTKNKDHTIYLSQYWFIHLDELETLRSNDISAIKSYITRQRISVRAAYGRYKTNFVRRASFLGSVNDDKFLSDITGNRRWLVFKVNKIDYQHDINPDDIWSQAYKLWKEGYRYWFDIDEIKEINNQNERFRTVSLEEELFLRYFSCNSVKGKGEMLSGSEVIQKILYNVPAFSSKMGNINMGKALAKHSLYKQMKGGIQRYWVDYNGVDAPVESPSPMAHGGKGKINEEDDDLPF